MNLASHWMGYLLAAAALSHALGIDRQLLRRRSFRSAGPAEHDPRRRESMANEEVDDLFAGDEPPGAREDGDGAAWPDRWM
ncbi:MAG: hypothetical protein U0836_05740 [Pirellulales bacterium]